MVDLQFKTDKFKLSTKWYKQLIRTSRYRKKRIQNLHLAPKEARFSSTVPALGMIKDRQSDDLIEYWQDRGLILNTVVDWVQCFINPELQFERHRLLNRPMQWFKNRGYTFIFWCICYDIKPKVVTNTTQYKLNYLHIKNSSWLKVTETRT